MNEKSTLIRTVIGINFGLGIGVIGAVLGALWGVGNAWAGTKVGTWIANEIIPPHTGPVLAVLEGLVLGFIGAALGLVVIGIALSLVGGGGGGIPIFSAGGSLLGWLGAAPSSGAGCGVAGFAVPALFVTPIVAAITGAGGSSEAQLLNWSQIILGGLFGIAGLVGGVVYGFRLNRQDAGWAGLVGFIDGALIGGFLLGGWAAAITVAVIGAAFFVLLWHIESNKVGCLLLALVGFVLLGYLVIQGDPMLPIRIMKSLFG